MDASQAQTRLIGRLTELSLGCAQLGNLYGAMTDEQARATVDAAWAAGIRYFDTAPHYGLGLSERRLGNALAGRPRGEFVVSTKVGRLLQPLLPTSHRDDQGFDVPATHRRVWDFTRDGVRRSIVESLERLTLRRPPSRSNRIGAQLNAPAESNESSYQNSQIVGCHIAVR